MTRILTALLCVCLTSFASAQVVVGGAGTVGCQGPGDPPPLSNGDIASGIITFSYDAAAAELTLVVENTTPVVAGQATAVITDVLFNFPADVTGVSIASQSQGSGSTAPSFSVASNSQNQGCLGDFGARLVNGNGISGSIANAAATNLPGPPNSMVIGPATFVLSIAGTGLGALTTADFEGSYSTGGSFAVQAGLKFQGSSDDGSGKLGGAPCPTALSIDLGGECGNPAPTLTIETPFINTVASLTFDSAFPFAPGLAFVSFGPVTNPITVPGIPCVFHVNPNALMIMEFGTDLNGDFSIGLPFTGAQAGLELTVQARVWGAGGFLGGDHFSGGVFIRVGCP